jgi:hypothetical protein
VRWAVALLLATGCETFFPLEPPAACLSADFETDLGDDLFVGTHDKLETIRQDVSGGTLNFRMPVGPVVGDFEYLQVASIGTFDLSDALIDIEVTGVPQQAPDVSGANTEAGFLISEAQPENDFPANGDGRSFVILVSDNSLTFRVVHSPGDTTHDTGDDYVPDRDRHWRIRTTPDAVIFETGNGGDANAVRRTVPRAEFPDGFPFQTLTVGMFSGYYGGGLVGDQGTFQIGRIEVTGDSCL